ncbi:unnamed protein product, partial [marine sediment metagenome]
NRFLILHAIATSKFPKTPTAIPFLNHASVKLGSSSRALL